MSKFKIIYKGNFYTLEIKNNEVLNCFDENGFKIYNPALLHNLEIVFNLK